MKSLRWSPEAVSDLESILDFIDSEFGKTGGEKVSRDILHRIQLLKKLPLAFPKAGYRGLRKMVIHQHLCVFYKVLPQSVFIVRLWDTRMDDGVLK